MYSEFQCEVECKRSASLVSTGSMLASGDDDRTIIVWDTQMGTSLHTLRSERPYERMNIRDVKGMNEL